MGAIEQASQNRAPAPLMLIKQELDRYDKVALALLPANVTVERFKATIANAIRKSPQLLGCDPGTVVGSALRAAQLNLEPNDGRNLCHLVPYGKECTFQLGYGGVLELLRRAVPGVTVSGRPVFPNDEFDIDYATNTITHRPHFVANPDAGRGGNAYCWYVRIVYPDGSAFVHSLDKEGVEYHRKFSKMGNSGMWKDSYDAAALKSVVLDMRRWLPQSAEMVDAITDDGRVIQAGEIRHDPDPWAGDVPMVAGDDITDAEVVG